LKRDTKTPTVDKPAKKDTNDESAPERPMCGIIMPISAIDGLPTGHWEDVKNILREAIESAGFKADLVSDTEETTIIQRTIVHNLYNNAIVVCDVSGKNPNVMFELGIRLTFDRPTVVVKDDHTQYSFDSSPIEHLIYPRDLRHNQIVQFMEKLSGKVKATYEKAAKDPNYSTFLKYFGEFKVPQLEQKEVSADQFIIARLEELSNSISRLERQSYRSSTVARRAERTFIQIPIPSSVSKQRLVNLVAALPEIFDNVQPRLVEDKLILAFPDAQYGPAERENMERTVNKELQLLASFSVGQYEQLPTTEMEGGGDSAKPT
jgi:hypothetical protein